MQKLYKGLFWLSNKLIVIKAECDTDGNFFKMPNPNLLSENGKEFNHKKAWQTLPKSDTNGKPFHYYPRGRVQIKRGKAIIFTNENILPEIEKIKQDFGLSDKNGIVDIKVKVDMSDHYLSEYDKN